MFIFVCCWLLLSSNNHLIISTQLKRLGVTKLNRVRQTTKPPSDYQIRSWSQRGIKVNRPNHGDIPLRLPQISSSGVMTQLQVDRFASENSHKDNTWRKRTDNDINHNVACRRVHQPTRATEWKFDVLWGLTKWQFVSYEHHGFDPIQLPPQHNRTIGWVVWPQECKISWGWLRPHTRRQEDRPHSFSPKASEEGRHDFQCWRFSWQDDPARHV